jgi:hypothetical protein
VGYHSHRLWLLLLLLCMEMWGREAIGNPRSPSTLHWSRLCVVACGVSHILFLHLELFPLRIVPESPAYPSNARAPSSISDVNERTRRNLWLLISVFLVSVVFAYHAVSRLRSDIHFEREDGDYRRDVVGDIIHENAFISVPPVQLATEITPLQPLSTPTQAAYPTSSAPPLQIMAEERLSDHASKFKRQESI